MPLFGVFQNCYRFRSLEIKTLAGTTGKYYNLYCIYNTGGSLSLITTYVILLILFGLV